MTPEKSLASFLKSLAPFLWTLGLLAATLLLPLTAPARGKSGPEQPQSYEVRCDGEVWGTRHVVNVRVTGQGKIIPYSKRRLVNATEASIFSPLSRPPYSYRSIMTFQAPNGYFVLTAKTYLDVSTIGISPSLDVGYFTHNDSGTGHGHMTVRLKCRPQSIMYH